MVCSGKAFFILILKVFIDVCYSDIQSYLPKSKISGSKDTDDPTSPYSINYSGEYNKNNQGYSYVISNKNGNHSGYLKFSSLPKPQHALKISWPNLGNFRTGVNIYVVIKKKNRISWNYFISAKNERYLWKISFDHYSFREK